MARGLEESLHRVSESLTERNDSPSPSPLFLPPTSLPLPPPPALSARLSVPLRSSIGVSVLPGRGIFFNEAKTFLVWCNEEDHMRLISMEKGGNLTSVYSRLVEGVSKVQKKLEFSRHPRLGYLTFCPTNLGTTIRASVHIRLPKVSADFPRFEQIADMYNLQVRNEIVPFPYSGLPGHETSIFRLCARSATYV